MIRLRLKDWGTQSCLDSVSGGDFSVQLTEQGKRQLQYPFVEIVFSRAKRNPVPWFKATFRSTEIEVEQTQGLQMKYRLKNREFQAQLDRLSRGDFSRRLDEWNGDRSQELVNFSF